MKTERNKTKEDKRQEWRPEEEYSRDNSTGLVLINKVEQDIQHGQLAMHG